MASRKVEERWFRVKGYALPSTDPRPKMVTQDFQLTVTVTGNYFNLMTEATALILKNHGFFVVSMVSQSTKKECL